MVRRGAANLEGGAKAIIQVIELVDSVPTVELR